MYMYRGVKADDKSVSEMLDFFLTDILMTVFDLEEIDLCEVKQLPLYFKVNECLSALSASLNCSRRFVLQLFARIFRFEAEVQVAGMVWRRSML